nr:retrotransposon protein, putative, unclassified [Ipomoea batatas]
MGSDLNVESAIKALQKSVKALELQHDKIDNLSATVASLSSSSQSQAAALARLEKLVQQLLTSQGKQPIHEEDFVAATQTEGASTATDIGDHHPRFSPYPKIEFPLFSGEEDPMVWLLRCESSFRHAGTLDQDRVPLAAHHMIGEAQLWYHSEIAVSQFTSWASFKEECCLSFGPPRSLNPLGELKLLFQTGRHIDDYIKDFRAQLARAGTVLPAQRSDLFTGGLDEVLRIDVERTKPGSLNEAMNTARDFYRKCHLLGLLTAKPPQRSDVQASRTPSARFSPPPKAPTSQANASRPQFKFLSPAEKADMDAKKLCYNCDERFFPGHKCRRLFMLWTLEDGDEKPAVDEYVEEEPGISFNAIVGLTRGNMMKVLVKFAGSHITALLDSGSTDNFIDEDTAVGLGLHIKHVPALRVLVANGDRISTIGVCEHLCFSKDGAMFSASFYVLPLAGFQMVLGVKWLRELGRISWDFRTLCMSFQFQDKEITWSAIEGESLPTFHSMQPSSSHEEALPLLLSSFEDIFADVTALPPSRDCDHRIVLLSGSNPVAVRPYRYPQLLKNEIERQCIEMLRLPVDSRVHDVFHVCLLKEFKGDPPAGLAHLPPAEEGRCVLSPRGVAGCKEGGGSTSTASLPTILV